MPGIEYSIFPYSESTSRLFTLQYMLFGKYSSYFEETIYGEIEEYLYGEKVEIDLEFKQTWGDIDLRFEGKHYFHDSSKYNLGFYPYISIKITRGFSFDISGNYSCVRDQFSLPKGGASHEEVLLRRKELETDYSYYISFGISYTFGSIYSNIVNPRFE